jgi:hypothetical protein
MLVPLALLAQLSASPSTFLEASAVADKQLASLPVAQAAEISSSLANAVSSAFAACPDSLTSFSVVLAIDGSGKVQRTWRQGNSALANCIERQLATATLSKPPFVPFYITYGFAVEP